MSATGARPLVRRLGGARARAGGGPRLGRIGRWVLLGALGVYAASVVYLFTGRFGVLALVLVVAFVLDARRKIRAGRAVLAGGPLVCRDPDCLAYADGYDDGYAAADLDHDDCRGDFASQLDADDDPGAGDGGHSVRRGPGADSGPASPRSADAVSFDRAVSNAVSLNVGYRVPGDYAGYRASWDAAS